MTERIRINGQPIDKEKFADYFWQVYDTSKKNSSEEFKFPEQAPYFKFLTILAFNIFLKEKVDVAIIEGEFSVISYTIVGFPSSVCPLQLSILSISNNA